MLLSELNDPVWVDTPDALLNIAKHLGFLPIFAIDTESNSLFAYREQVCLIQISTETEDYLIDPLAIHDLSALAPLFANPQIEKVFHAGEYDLICLKRDFGFEFNHLFDTMIAGRVLGREIFGLSGMLEAEFGISLDKKWQRANWGIRPIPPAQLAYARMDSHFLIPLRNCLKQKLIEVDRLELAEEDFSRLERTPIPQISGEKENCWKISGRQDLTSRQLAVLCRLYEYREEQAKKANLPPFKILSTDTLAAIALVSPTSVEELENIPGLTPLLQKRYGAGLLETIALGQRSEPPRRPNHTRKDDDLIQRVDALKSWRKKTAAEMHVESDVILPREIVEQIYTVNPRTLSELAAIMDNFPLRLQKFGPEILQAVKPKETE